MTLSIFAILYLSLIFTNFYLTIFIFILQEICTLVLAVEWNGDQISEINIFGLLFCLGGISFHVALKAIAASNSVHGKLT